MFEIQCRDTSQLGDIICLNGNQTSAVLRIDPACTGAMDRRAEPQLSCSWTAPELISCKTRALLRHNDVKTIGILEKVETFVFQSIAWHTAHPLCTNREKYAARRESYSTEMQKNRYTSSKTSRHIPPHPSLSVHTTIHFMHAGYRCAGHKS
mgnify:CR=1 FL=1